jgi:hypothetical protein
MTGIGIGRFAKRNTAKTTEASLSGAAKVCDPPRVPDTITLAATDSNDGFPQQDHRGNDFCFSNDDDAGNNTASFMDDASFGNPFGGGEGTAGGSELLLFGDNEFLPQSDTGTNRGESVAASALGTATTTSDVTTKPKAVFGFSRFANKNKTPLTDASTNINININTNKNSNDETRIESKSIVVTPNNDATIDKTSTIKSHENNGNSCNNSNDNGYDNSNSNHNGNHNGHTQSANKNPPPQASNASPSLTCTTNPPPVANDLDVTPPYPTRKARENPRRVSLVESSSFLPERPFLQPRAAESNQKPQDKSKQQQQRQNEIKKTKISGIIPAFNPGTVSILGQSSRGGGSDSRRVSNGAKNEAPFSRQQEKNEERQLRREEYANVTDNRRMRKNVSGATAVTPISSIAGGGHRDSANGLPSRGIARGNQNQTETEIPTTTTVGIAPSQKQTTILPKTFDRGSGTASTGKSKSDLDTTTSFESNQEARFLTTIRDTEDLQEKIEVDLLCMNDRFSEHYALLLRDLDAAVDLLDKLEDIEKFADETIANYQHCRPSRDLKGVVVAERASCASGSNSSAPESNRI